MKPFVLGVAAALAVTAVLTGAILFATRSASGDLTATMERIERAVRAGDLKTVEQYVDFAAVADAYAVRVTDFMMKSPAGEANPDGVRKIAGAMLPKLRRALENGFVSAITSESFAGDDRPSLAAALRDISSKGEVSAGDTSATVTFVHGDEVVLTKGERGWRVTEYRLSESTFAEYAALAKNPKGEGAALPPTEAERAP